MACPTSECLASATLAWTSPVLGSKTSPKRPDPPLTALPPMKWPISRMSRSPPIFERSGKAFGHSAPFLSQFLQLLGCGSLAVSELFLFREWLAFTPLWQRQSRVALDVTHRKTKSYTRWWSKGMKIATGPVLRAGNGCPVHAHSYGRLRIFLDVHAVIVITTSLAANVGISEASKHIMLEETKQRLKIEIVRTDDRCFWKDTRGKRTRK